MDSVLKDFFSSGKKLLSDTKEMKIKDAKKKKATVETQLDADPHKNFIRRITTEKPRKAELVEDLKKFIAGAEAEL